MKKWLSKTLACLLACTSVFSIAACGGSNPYGDLDDGEEEVEKVLDPTKTQLQVNFFDAGYGSEYMRKLIARFEEAYKDVSYEDGKTGIQVWQEGDMRQYTAQDIASGSKDVYFMESADYYSICASGAGALEDLTGIVTNPNPDDNGKTILSKLSQQQKNYYGITTTDGDAKYYAIPHYEGGYGLIYNKDLFDRENYYMADGANRVVTSATEKRGTGPDGQYGTSDDGLPRTYDEFFTLCDEMAYRGDTPICWSGKYSETYLAEFVNYLAADYEGVEQMQLNLSFSGTAKDLVVMDNGKVVFENGKPKTESLEITTANGAELSRQLGKYYALQFLEKIMTTDGYYNDDAYTPSHTHVMAQQDFLEAGTKFSEDEDMGFLIDGPWWEMESEAVSSMLGKQDAAFAQKNRNFGWLPLPKATEEKVGTGSVYLDSMSAIVCVKSGLGPKKQAALDFVRFSATDESLVEFTQITGTFKSYNYTLTEEQQAELTPFAKSVLEHKSKSALYVADGNNAFYLKNRTALSTVRYYAANGVMTPVAEFKKENRLSAQTYFEKMYDQWKKSQIWE